MSISSNYGSMLDSDSDSDSFNLLGLLKKKFKMNTTTENTVISFEDEDDRTTLIKEQSLIKNKPFFILELEIKQKNQQFSFFKTNILAKYNDESLCEIQQKLFFKLKRKMKIFPTKKNLIFNFQKYLDKYLFSYEIIISFAMLSSEKRNNLKRKYWSQFEIRFMVFMIGVNILNNSKEIELFGCEDWEFVGNLLVEKSSKSCYFKWHSLLKCQALRSAWNKNEDNFILKSYAILSENEKKRPKWSEIANKLNQSNISVVFRSSKNVRERFLNHLNPFLNKGSWTNIEDLNLLLNVWKFGKKWAEISRNLKTRNENDVKNRYLSLEKLYLNDPTRTIRDENLKISNVLKNFISKNPILNDFMNSNMNENIYANDFNHILMIERNSMANLEHRNNELDIE